MNVYDSERMTEALAAEGYVETERHRAKRISPFSTRAISARRRRRRSIPISDDCATSRTLRARSGKQTLDRRLPAAWRRRRAPRSCAVHRPSISCSDRRAIIDLPEFCLREVARTGKPIVETAFPDEDKFQALPPQRAPKAASAFLTVQEGCDKFCTFCVVPYTRGMEFSRPVAALADEVRRLVDRGVREITLLGQNVNGYHGEGPDGKAWSLARLISHLAKVEGLARLRYTTSHPRDMSDDLIAAHGDEEKLMPYLHLPFQAGADRILAAMNRKHTAKDYLALIGRVRAVRAGHRAFDRHHRRLSRRDGSRISTRRSTSCARSGFAHAYSFKYSPRPGTPASNMDDQVPEEAKRERLERLQDLIDERSDAFQRGFRRARHAGSVREGRPPRRAARGPLALPAARACRGR